MGGPGLPHGVLFFPRRVYDEIGILSFLFERHLPAQPRHHIALPGAFPPHRPLHLLIFPASHQYDSIITLVASRLDQDGRFHHRDSPRLARPELRHQLVFPANYCRMHQAVQPLQPLRRSEHQRRQRAPLDSPLSVQDLAPKFPHHLRVCFSARIERRVSQLIRLNQEATARRQRLAHEGLAASQSPREANLQHIPGRRSAAATVLAISMAMVSGPTPPGTGVYAPPISATACRWTSPASTLPRLSNTLILSAEWRKIRAASSRFSIRLVPTSITVAPGLIYSPVIKAARPIAATKISPSRHTAAKSRVFEWQIVTVACSCNNRNATGFPTMSLRPTTTARFPAISIPYRLSSSRIPAGVHARGPGNPATSLPTLHG